MELHCEFVFPRPLGHFGTGKNSDKLKASAPTHHTKTPDADKLTRGIGDAISVTKVLPTTTPKSSTSTPTSVTRSQRANTRTNHRYSPRSMNAQQQRQLWVAVDKQTTALKARIFRQSLKNQLLGGLNSLLLPFMLFADRSHVVWLQKSSCLVPYGFLAKFARSQLRTIQLSLRQ